jgi:hypothetical protein
MSDYGVKIGIKADTGIMLLKPSTASSVVNVVGFYKVIHHLVVIPYSNLLIPVYTRTRHTNPNLCRHIQTSKDCYKYSYERRIKFS